MNFSLKLLESTWMERGTYWDVRGACRRSGQRAFYQNLRAVDKQKSLIQKQNRLVCKRMVSKLTRKKGES